LLTFLLTILAFGLMIAIHELGHFIVARLCGVGVEKFSIGFGAALAHFERDGIEYRIGWIPLGGYVKMTGENPDDEDTKVDNAFQNAKWWRKALIILAGPIANLIFGALLFFIAYLIPMQMEDHHPVVAQVEPGWSAFFTPGDSIYAVNDTPVKGWYQALSTLEGSNENVLSLVRDGAALDLRIAPGLIDSLVAGVRPVVPSIVGDLQTGMPAWKAGLKTGDVILAVDSVYVDNWYQMRELIVQASSDTIELILQRGDEVFTRSMVLERSFATENQPMIGITQYMPVRFRHSFSLVDSFRSGMRTTKDFIVIYYRGLYHLIQKPEEIKNSLGGPVMIVSMSQQAGQKGINSLILFFGSISLILMVMNLLPIPILDGGHIIFALVEGIIGRPVPLKIQSFLQRIGFALLIMLMVYAFYSDIMKLGMRIFNGL
jgi:regulator of sigma E protease